MNISTAVRTARMPIAGSAAPGPSPRAMLRGFVRDRTALAFSILLPVLFLALLGSLYGAARPG